MYSEPISRPAIRQNVQKPPAAAQTAASPLKFTDYSRNSIHISQLKSYIEYDTGHEGIPWKDVTVKQGGEAYKSIVVDTNKKAEDRAGYFRAASEMQAKVGSNVRSIIEHIDPGEKNRTEDWEENHTKGKALTEFKCKIKSNEADPHLWVNVEFSQKTEGYIVEVYDEAHEKTDKTPKGKPAVKSGRLKENAHNYYEQGGIGYYGQIHETGGGKNLLEASRSGSFDIHTKLVAEAARFQCVREHLGEITNSTKFGFKNNKRSYYVVTFETLWRNWDRWFHKTYNLSNAMILTALRQHKGEQEVEFKRGRLKDDSEIIQIFV